MSRLSDAFIGHAFLRNYMDTTKSVNEYEKIQFNKDNDPTPQEMPEPDTQDGEETKVAEEEKAAPTPIDIEEDEKASPASFEIQDENKKNISYPHPDDRLIEEFYEDFEGDQFYTIEVDDGVAVDYDAETISTIIDTILNHYRKHWQMAFHPIFIVAAMLDFRVRKIWKIPYDLLQLGYNFLKLYFGEEYNGCIKIVNDFMGGIGIWSDGPFAIDSNSSIEEIYALDPVVPWSLCRHS